MRDSRAIASAPYLFCALLFCGTSAIADADIEAGRVKSAACIGCHGPNGNSMNGRYPVLAGQAATYIYFQLHDFKEGRRTDPTMSSIAASLTDDDILNLAVFFSSQIPIQNSYTLDPQRVALGAQQVQKGSCTACHLAGLAGHNEIPKLAGQQPDYVAKQLTAFRNSIRIYDGGIMRNVTRMLSDDDILNLAHYIGSLPPVVSEAAPPPAGAQQLGSNDVPRAR